MHMNLRNYLLSTLFICANTFLVPAQTKWVNPLVDTPNGIHGQYWQEEIKGSYVRLPDRVRSKVRDDVWNLSRHSA